jgi:hypothetical protein
MTEMCSPAFTSERIALSGRWQYTCTGEQELVY